MNSKDKKKSKFLEEAVAGTLAVGIAKTCFAPLERIKLLLQTQNLKSHHKKTYFRQEGLRTLWRGNTVNWVKAWTSSTARGLGAEGVLGASLITALVYPLDLVRTRMALEGTKYKSLFHCIASTYSDHGFKALYQGCAFSLGIQVPYYLVAYSVHNYLLDYLYNPSDSTLYQLLEFFGSGSIAAGITQTVFYPADTLKRQIQATGAPGYKSPFKSSFEAIRGVLKTKGASYLYKGCLTNIARVVPTVGVQLSTYDMIKEYSKKSI